VVAARRVRQDDVAVLLHRSSRHERGGESFRLEASFRDHEYVGLGAEVCPWRGGDDEGVDILQRLHARIEQELRRLSVRGYLIEVRKERRRQRTAAHLGEMEDADGGGVRRNEGERVVFCGRGQCDRGGGEECECQSHGQSSFRLYEVHRTL